MSSWRCLRPLTLLYLPGVLVYSWLCGRQTWGLRLILHKTAPASLSLLRLRILLVYVPAAITRTSELSLQDLAQLVSLVLSQLLCCSRRADQPLQHLSSQHLNPNEHQTVAAQEPGGTLARRTLGAALHSFLCKLQTSIAAIFDRHHGLGQAFSQN
jgi:hypothetical protein